MSACVRRIAELIGRHHPRTVRTRRLEVLAQTELPVVALELAHRAFVYRAIARDVLERAVDRDVPSAAADDHAEFALVVERARDARAAARRAAHSGGTNDAGTRKKICGCTCDVVSPVSARCVLKLSASAQKPCGWCKQRRVFHVRQAVFALRAGGRRAQSRETIGQLQQRIERARQVSASSSCTDANVASSTMTPRLGTPSAT